MIEQALSRIDAMVDKHVQQVRRTMYKFKHKQAQRILHHPLQGTPQEQYKTSEQVTTSFYLPGKQYEGKWYKQIGPSCMIWATANAMEATMGVNLEENKELQLLITGVHAFATVKHDDTFGADHNDLKEVIDYLSLPFRVDTYGFIAKSLPEHFKDSQGNITQEGIDNEATLIAALLKRKKGIIIYVDSNKYYKINDATATHALAVVGYTENFSDVICIDSNHGIVKVPFKHLYDSLSENSFSVLSRIDY